MEWENPQLATDDGIEAQGLFRCSYCKKWWLDMEGLDWNTIQYHLNGQCTGDSKEDEESPEPPIS